MRVNRNWAIVRAPASTHCFWCNSFWSAVPPYSLLKPLCSFHNIVMFNVSFCRCADISNVLKPFDDAAEWAVRITDEFFAQVCSLCCLNQHWSCIVHFCLLINHAKCLNFEIIQTWLCHEQTNSALCRVILNELGEWKSVSSVIDLASLESQCRWKNWFLKRDMAEGLDHLACC